MTKTQYQKGIEEAIRILKTDKVDRCVIVFVDPVDYQTKIWDRHPIAPHEIGWEDPSFEVSYSVDELAEESYGRIDKHIAVLDLLEDY